MVDSTLADSEQLRNSKQESTLSRHSESFEPSMQTHQQTLASLHAPDSDQAAYSSNQSSEIHELLVAERLKNVSLTNALAEQEFLKLKLMREVETLLVLKEELDSVKAIFRDDELKQIRGAEISQAKDLEIKELRIQQAETVRQKDAEIERLSAAVSRLQYQADRLSHMNEQLQMESETVPAYIEKYHEERKLLKSKSAQKDRLIATLVEQYNGLLAQYRDISDKIKSGDTAIMHNETLDFHGPVTEAMRRMRETLIETTEIAGASPDSAMDEDETLRFFPQYSPASNANSLLFPPCEHCSNKISEV